LKPIIWFYFEKDPFLEVPWPGVQTWDLYGFHLFTFSTAAP